MNVNFESKNDKLIVHMAGELDHHSAEEVRNKIDDRIERDNLYNIVMDFSQVTFMDSSGIGVIIGRYKKLLDKKGKLYVTKVNGSAKRVFELSGMFKIIPLYDSIEQALDNM